jgi:hypothetical protein
MGLLTKKEILGALERLGQLAQEKGDEVKLLVLGGGVMVIVYETRLVAFLDLWETAHREH